MSQTPRYTDVATLALPGYEGEVLEHYTSAEGQHWLAGLQQRLKSSDADLLYRQRNRVYRLDDPVNATTDALCIKAFKQPDALRSAIYRRTGSKAARAHAYSRHLYAQGADVAEPIGYIERWNGKQLVESYLLTRYIADSTDLYSEMTYLLRERPYAEDFIKLLRFSAHAIRTMHDSGFIHGDLGPQNILMRRTGPAEWAQPAFIDLNRGKLQPNPTLRQRAQDMERMKIPSHFRRIFFHLYFEDNGIPVEFQRWADRYHNRFLLHQRSRKWRHPVRTVKRWLNTSPAEERKAVSTGQPSPRNAWLWDSKSAQPSVMLQVKDRKQQRAKADLWRTLASFLRQALPVYRQYKTLKSTAFQRPVAMANRLGVCVEINASFEEQQALLAQTPGLPVFVRLYFHLGPDHLARCSEAIRQLAEAGHEVSIGLIQSRQAVLEPERWQAFMSNALDAVHPHIHCVEIGHAVNRVKWGFWNLEEMAAIWQGVADLKALYPALTFLGPAVNDFEFQYYPPLLDAAGESVDALSNHLYVDRRGAPENAQSGFATLEKCLLAKAMANQYSKQGFYITEVNWPLKNTGEYSPLAGAYQPKGKPESNLHISEQDSAAYMVRYALIALCSGTTERIWWWRLVHPGFGLVDDLNGWRERPGWPALVQFHNLMANETFTGREEKDGALWWHFGRFSLVYSLSQCEITLGNDISRITNLTGQTVAGQPGDTLAIDGNPVYLHQRHPQKDRTE
ncbi:lipopolysaccharide kinase InaA family protein [Saccharospirillum impatiens]|uniref:lipopolysaccharide kinase InaA family protein n=1 Tax=Saccharospirillum impatiens TaxID=169438 RepID=UPI00041FCE97|nr:lipopolysaccharide kinase InaA family protein [Saccharospirillum impatiens]